MIGAVLKTGAVLWALTLGVQSRAQSPIQPGQIATAYRMEVLPPSVENTSAATVSAPSVGIAQVPAQPASKSNRLWIGSMFALAGASAFDAGSSWGKYEKNSLLASPNGTFGARGLSLKAGLTAAVIVPQILMRRHQGIKTKFAIFNFAGAGVFTGVAIHNIGVAAPKS